MPKDLIGGGLVLGDWGFPLPWAGKFEVVTNCRHLWMRLLKSLPKLGQALGT